ncbi:MAG: gamma-glutamylcyclotransferase [Cystobacter sp.]
MNYQLRTWSECLDSLGRALEAAPHDARREDSWLLVYGSMLDDPPFHAKEQRPATLEGWERLLCLADPKMRGTERRPGLSLGLVRGGHCRGLAYRLSASTVREDLERVWRREMVLPFYVPCWLQVHTPGGVLHALTFCTDLDGPLFEGAVEEAALLERLATCEGENGSNADYLETTVRQLKQVGIPDEGLAHLLERVRLTRAALSGRG